MGATTATFEDGQDLRSDGTFVSTSVVRDCGSGDLGLGYPSDPGQAPLVSTWRFDCPAGPVRDSWGDNDGSTHGATRTDAGLLSTRAMAFDPDDGDTDGVTIPNDASLNPDELTLSLWVNPDTDGDLHADGTEVDEGSDPTNPLSVPLVGSGSPGPAMGDDAALFPADELEPVR